MNQTKKRLSIINLAISITDIETIQLQILKLRLLKTDEKIQEIVETLQAENYAQAQALIKTYIETPNNIILQRTFQKEKERQEAKEKEIIEEFDLFTVPSEEEPSEIKTIDLDDMLAMEKERIESPTPLTEKDDHNFDALLNMSSEDIMPDNIEIDLTTSDKNDFWKSDEEIEENPVEKDTFFDTFSTTENINEEREEDTTNTDFTQVPVPENEAIEEETKNEVPTFDNTENAEYDIETLIKPLPDTEPEEIVVKEETPASNDTEETPTPIIPMDESMEKEIDEDEIDKQESFFTQNTEETLAPLTPNSVETKVKSEETSETAKETIQYKAIPYIDKKFLNMQVQYPSNETLSESFPSVSAWISKISQEGYSEEEVEKILEYIESCQSKNPSEAAQLLLITAATESKYAQFQLARALFKGELLQKNLPEAFTIINRLAVNDDYPEAICDLAQFYEYGVGIEKDKDKALDLYEEAMNLGIKRATQHFERLQNERKRFFSFLKR